MKRISLIFAIIPLTALTLFAEHVDSETARKVATTFLNNNGAKTTQLTDLSKEAGFNNLYIFNGNPGFVVMAADDCVKPILGYSLTGQFIAKEMPEDVRWWLQGYNNQIQDMIESAQTAAIVVERQWKEYENGTTTLKTRTEVGPFIQTKWDQTYPYNYYCPTCSSGGSGGHVYTGCVATAMAQVIKYHEAPVHGIGSHSYTHNLYGTQTAAFGITEYDWTNMPTKINSYSNSTIINAVSTLIYHCGVAVDMNYGSDGSGAYSSAIAPALKKYFNFSQTTTLVERSDNDSEWIALMRSELDASRPIIYGGMDDATNPQSGHSFVCDGYGKDGFSNYYFNFNWGWSGSYNGYFSIDDMTPGGNGAGGGTHNYSYLQDAVIGIQPSTNKATPTDLTLTATGSQNISLEWNPASGAVSYNIYRNNNYIGNSTTNTYTEKAPFGTNVYYVRSMDANGELSLSSNMESITVDYQSPIAEDLRVTLLANNANLSWSAPEWCYPETPSASLTYGDGVYESSVGFLGTGTMYWGHRYLSSTLENYAGMVIYKISFYASYEGTYQCYIYKGTNNSKPETQLSTTTFTVSETGWYDIDLSENLLIDTSQDLWVFLFDPEYKYYPASFSIFSGHTEGCYYSDADPMSTDLEKYTGSAWLIRTYLTEGTYTYNLYDGKTKVNGAVPITGTSYNINSLANGAHQYTVKTNYYGGESEASNMVGITLGAAEINELNLDTDDVMTVTSGSSLTVNGTLTNTNPAHLLIENNAQLIHPGNAVQATLQKTIEAYSTAAGVNDGWYTIASPVDALGVGLATTGTYDLYTYDEKNMLWLNQEKPTNNITQFNEGQGFLYANAALTTLAFAGNMRATDEQITVPLSCQSNAELNGFNLVGNPFSRNLIPGDLTLGGVALTTYYSVEGGSELVTHNIGTDPIKPGQGFLVQASTTGQNLVFNPPVSKEEAKQAYISIEATDGSFTDRAFVQFSEGNTLNKMTLGDNHVQISIRHDDTDYAAINANTEERELQLYFKAAHNGIHTLSINTTNLEFDYLHLIDNLTGADVNLLQSPSYSFEAKTNNYASRFKLVFNAETNNDVYGNDFVDGKTLILDMTGRVVATDRNARLVPGIYILQTTNGNETHSKKIIIK